MPLRRSIWDGCLDLTLILVSYGHVILSPYTKVEESFYIQAIHDILVHGVSTSSLDKYDHQVFSGAVPRSFIGPLALSIFSYPVLLLFNILGFVKTSADAALFIRFTLATLYTSSIVFFSYKTLADASLSVQKQRWQRRIFIIISMLQFHPLFWAGRTTPNGIVSPIVFMALALVFSIRRTYRKRDYYLGLSLLTASQVIARMELVGIVIPVAASGLISRSIGGSFVSRSIRIAVTGLLTALVSIALSVLVDTYFWKRPLTLWNPFNSSATDKAGILWPELEAILFNVVEGKSSDWGVSPWYSYLTTHLPKLQSFTTPLCLIGIVSAPWSASPRFSMLFVITFHVVIMSQLGHKELRFVSYLNPLLNIFAARSAVSLCFQRKQGYRMLGVVIVAGLLAATALVTVISVIASASNYPGGEAMRTLHNTVREQNVNVHIDVLPAMTGVNLFQSSHLYRPQTTLPSALPSSGLVWKYDKTEDLDPSYPVQWSKFTHLISDDRHCHLSNEFELLLSDGFIEFDRLSLKQRRAYFSSLLSAPGVCWRSGLMQRKCLYAIMPVQFHWREVVWLCKRRRKAMQ